MLRFRSCIAARFLSSTSAATTISPLHRFLSAAAAAPSPAVSPNPSFAVEEYLVDTCGLSRAKALRASTKLSHLKSPSNPDAVLAYLAGLGLSGADVAALVAKDPEFLCAKVEKTLSPVVAGLTSLGLSRSEIGRLVSLTGRSFRRRSFVSRLAYYLSLFGSYEKVFQALKNSSYLIGMNLEKVVKPNVSLLRECRIGDFDKLCRSARWLLGTNPERVQAMVACAEGLGVPRRSGMFRIALHAVAFLDEEKIAAKLEYLKQTLKWSDAEVRIAVSKAPQLMRRSNDTLQRMSKFLISEVGLEPAYIARRPAVLTYSLEGRLRPRYYVVKFLKRNGLLDYDWRYGTIAQQAEKVFVEKFIRPHKEAAPHLAEDYATACRGKCRLVSDLHEPGKNYENW